MKNVRVIVAVTNDLITDRRVSKVCDHLFQKGWDITLVGRKKRSSPPIDKRQYQTKRFRLLFEKGALFYAGYNLRLFFYLLFSRVNIIVSNDLDTLLACYLAARIKKAKLVYDTHEYFTGVPELLQRPLVRKIWEKIEKWIFPKLKHIITVNQSIADLYIDQYNKPITVVRNISDYRLPEKIKERSELQLPGDKRILIIQGAGINIDRGNEEMIDAMEFLDGFLLLIIGDGDVVPQLKERVQSKNLEKKVRFFPRMPYEQLMQYTCNADMGITLDKDTNINYRFSLPNKLFDFIHAGIPVLSSNLPEVGGIVKKYGIGTIVPSHQPQEIADSILSFFNDPEKLEKTKVQLKKAALDLTWEKERKILDTVYSSLELPDQNNHQ